MSVPEPVTILLSSGACSYKTSALPLRHSAQLSHRIQYHHIFVYPNCASSWNSDCKTFGPLGTAWGLADSSAAQTGSCGDPLLPSGAVCCHGGSDHLLWR